ncbi:ribosomal protein S20 [Peptoanaerobacter stomatis]|uniref:Small ribosomal subunit protein bS20 n=1 Tax=Peptoanaerobacter stomatis TaxID=796937 RepID=G9XED7_9FIRM|nr:30S ribosomal protein S20 [Peptoanaerobacter stomatis]EHL16748.1 ribosomal protein S20 [Peptoanaerobacter stomatis]EHL18795.1 30S ribosomal protein S20 [Peptoanaerobacter stomatis]EJU23492.1 ribosomal protein S20 [Peptoanaerobacter stomatis]NWO24309.1 30S ribosomal protein S20 [Peptostreptococcaceae bacterium oral taxon 081]
MANIKSAKKRIKVIQKKTLINKMRISQVKTAIKRFEMALSSGDMNLAGEKLRFAQKKLNQVAAKGSIHKNMAARKVSRLTKKFNLAQKSN